MFHLYAGDAVEMLLLHPDGSIETPVLGADLAAGERPQIVVPGDTWQGCSVRPDGGAGWALMGRPWRPASARRTSR